MVLGLLVGACVLKVRESHLYIHTKRNIMTDENTEDTTDGVLSSDIEMSISSVRYGSDRWDTKQMINMNSRGRTLIIEPLLILVAVLIVVVVSKYMHDIVGVSTQMAAFLIIGVMGVAIFVVAKYREDGFPV